MRDRATGMLAATPIPCEAAVVSADGFDCASPSQALSPLQAYSPAAANPPLEQMVGNCAGIPRVQAFGRRGDWPRPRAPKRSPGSIAACRERGCFARPTAAFAQVPVGDRLETMTTPGT